MTSFIIFDPQDILIFFYCDPSFKATLIESCDPITLANDEDVREEIENLIILNLTPYVAAYRHQNEAIFQVDCFENVLLAHKNFQQFMFVCLRSLEEGKQDFTTQVMLQHEAALFCKLIFFLYGNALYSIDKYNHLFANLCNVLTKWESIKLTHPLLLESIPQLFTCQYILDVCKNIFTHIELTVKFNCASRENKETMTSYMVLYKDNLVYRYQRDKVRLRQSDLQMVLMLTMAIGDLQCNLEASLDHDSTSENIDQLNSTYQQLVFLQSNFEHHLVVPHIYRKIVLSKHLHLVFLTEISSIQMISLSTLIQYVTEMKINVERIPCDGELNNGHLVINHLKQIEKYVRKQISPFQERLMISSLNSLSNLSHNSSRESSASSPSTANDHSLLIKDQADRVLTMILRDLQACYEEVLFKELFLNKFQQMASVFDEIYFEITNFLQSQLNVCLDFIQIKFDSQAEFASVFDDGLVAFLFVDRHQDYYVCQQRTRLPSWLFSTVIVQAFQQYALKREFPLLWHDNEYSYGYHRTSTSSGLKNNFTTCDLARIVLNQIDPSANYLSECDRSMELFCIFKTNSSSSSSSSPNTNLKQSVLEAYNIIVNQLRHITENEPMPFSNKYSTIWKQ